MQCPDQHLVETFGEMSNSVQSTLNERGKRYGEFKDHATITYNLKRVMRNTEKWETLADDQKEALDMVAHKIGRILNGDPNYDDSWHDIAGYAQLVANRLQKMLALDPARSTIPMAHTVGDALD